MKAWFGSITRSCSPTAGSRCWGRAPSGLLRPATRVSHTPRAGFPASGCPQLTGAGPPCCCWRRLAPCSGPQPSVLPARADPYPPEVKLHARCPFCSLPPPSTQTHAQHLIDLIPRRETPAGRCDVKCEPLNLGRGPPLHRNGRATQALVHTPRGHATGRSLGRLGVWPESHAQSCQVGGRASPAAGTKRRLITATSPPPAPVSPTL